MLRAGAKFLLCDPGGLPRHDRWCWTEDTSGSVITRGDVRISWAKKLKGKKSKTLTLLEYHPLGMHTFGQVIPTPSRVLDRISPIFSPFFLVFCAFSPPGRDGSNKPQAGTQSQETAGK